MRATKAKTSLQKHAILPKRSLLTNTNQGHSRRYRATFAHLTVLDGCSMDVFIMKSNKQISVFATLPKFTSEI